MADGGVKKPAGQTKSAGFEFGIRRTFAVPLERVWDFLLSGEGLEVWLGRLAEGRLEPGATYKTDDGAEGEVRVLKPYDHLRLTWKPAGWNRASTVQVRVLSAGAPKMTIAFHQENLAGAKERTEMKARWESVMERLEMLLK